MKKLLTFTLSVTAIAALPMFADAAAANPSSYPVMPMCLGECGGAYPAFNSQEYKNALKGFAFSECLNDYDTPYEKRWTEEKAYFDTIGTNGNDVRGVSNGRFRKIDFIHEINPLLKSISTKCYESARKLGTQMPFIDYSRGAKMGWYDLAIVSIRAKQCLSSDSSLSTNQINQYMASYRSSNATYTEIL